MSIGMLQYMDTLNFIEIIRLAWKQVWNFIEGVVKRGERETMITHQ